MLLTEVATYLQDQGIGTIGTTIFLGSMHDGPVIPDAAIALYETRGKTPDYVHESASINLETVGLQVIVRNSINNYTTARQTAEDIYQLLSAVQNTTLSSVRYLSIVPEQPPFFLGPDKSGRPLISCNYRIEKNLS